MTASSGPGRRAVLQALGAAVIATPAPAALGAAAPTATALRAAAPTATEIAVAFADTVLRSWPNPVTAAGDGFQYTSGMLLQALLSAHELTGDARYLGYVTEFVAGHLDADGAVVFPSSELSLDLIQPGGPLVALYRLDPDERYRTALDSVYARLLRQPRTAEGGFWHKQKYPREMWADGVYMGDRFAALYGAACGVDAALDLAVEQALLFASHAQLPGGLVRHGWDSDRDAAWADPLTGLSPLVWSRAVGWYLMAVVDILAALPADHPGRAPLLDVLRGLADGLAATQAGNGCWYQLPELPDADGNYVEASGTGFFVHALLTAVRTGCLDPDFRELALKGWQGLLTEVTVSGQGRATVRDVGPPQSVAGSVGGYTSAARRTNSEHGMLAAVLAACAVATS